jgi:Ca2+-binding EF-hand superfamily protein
MDLDEIQKVAPRLYAQTQVKGLIEGLSLDTTQESKDALTQNILLEIFKYTPVENSTELEMDTPFAWKQFDWNHDGFLQGPEIVEMLGNLRENEAALTSDEGGGSHPSTRDRILLLAEIFHEQLKG